jgi:serine protease Do
MTDGIPRRSNSDANQKAEDGGWLQAIPPVPSAACFSRFVFCALLGGLCVSSATIAGAQTQASITPTNTPAILAQPDDTQPEQREALRRELDRHSQILESQSAVLKIVAKLIGPSVVYIEADTPPDANHVRSVQEAGSGVIIQKNDRYYVLTNRHVVRGAAPAAIKVHLADGRLIYPTNVTEDGPADVAVLAITAPNLIAAPLGNSDPIQVGDFVLAVGSPFGLSHSVTFGIISAKGRRDLHVGAEVSFQDFLQTDAAINPGNSGGPLVNLRGEVIGINTAIESQSGGNEGIGFAIPINMFMASARQLIETGTVTRAFLGVQLSSKFGPAMAAELGLPRPVGAHITSVAPGSPAENAKLQPGDVVIEFNHTPVESDAHLLNIVSLTKVGKTVPVVVFRDRKPVTIMVEVGERSKLTR